ncbi:MAG: CvpA family protein [Xanthomonadales bacterium]|nr:CvpA family protein [Xanthomonadales bacterium]
MNWADYAILAMLGLSVLMGLWRGFVGEVLALAIWVAAFWLAWLGAPALAGHVPDTISSPSVRLLLAGAACFFLVLVTGAIVSFLMRRLVESSGLSGSDRMLGMLFGLVRGLALVLLAVLLLGYTPFAQDPWWRESRLLPGFAGSAAWLGEHLPGQVAEYIGEASALVDPPAPLALPTTPPAVPPPSPTR